MKTYNEIITAVRDGTAATDEELRYALVAAHYYLHRAEIDISKVLAQKNLEPGLRRTLEARSQSIYDLDSRDLDAFLRGSSMEPGISLEERTSRASKSVANTAVRLHSVLNSLRKVE